MLLIETLNFDCKLDSLATGQLIYSNISSTNNSWSMMPQLNEPSSCFLHTTNCDHIDSECDQNNHLWFEVILNIS